MNGVSNFTPLLMNKGLISELCSANGQILTETVSVRVSVECGNETRAAIEKELEKTINDCLNINDDLTGEHLNRRATVREITVTRTQTLFNIFFNLKNGLQEKDELIKIKDSTNIFDIIPGSIVEVSGTVSENDNLDALKYTINLIESIDKNFCDQSFKELNSPIGYDSIIKNLNSCYKKCTEYNTRDIILNWRGTKIILTANMENLIDNHPYDVLFGKCNILGKVINVIKEGEEISLIRRSGISNEFNNFIKSIEPHLDILRKKGVPIPILNLSIKGPTIQMIPIAIYL